MKTNKQKPTADELKKMIRAKHPSGKWATFFEVRDAAGFDARRSCDAMAMSLWPSAGLELHGFEIKRTRADFLNELRDPDKAGAFKRYCDRWWLVAASKDIVKDDLPEGWGMMWPRGDKLVVSIGAPKLDPEKLDRHILATILKRTSEGHGSLLESERNAAYQEGETRGRQSRSWKAERLEDELKELRESVSDFESASGIDITRYGGRRLGEAVAALEDLKGKWGDLKSLIGAADKVKQQACEVIAHCEELEAYATDVGLMATEADHVQG